MIWGESGPERRAFLLPLLPIPPTSMPIVTTQPPSPSPKASFAADGDLAPSGEVAWADQDATLKDMWLAQKTPEAIAAHLGRTVAAVRTRAVRLGLPRRSAPGRKPGVRPAKEAQTSAPVRKTASPPPPPAEAPVVQTPAPRICLMCLRSFPSQGRHNRICLTCKGSAEYAAGCSIPDIALGVSP